jgi:hypothetical protein
MCAHARKYSVKRGVFFLREAQKTLVTLVTLVNVI